jgi:hypothetical protein
MFFLHPETVLALIQMFFKLPFYAPIFRMRTPEQNLQNLFYRQVLIRWSQNPTP